MNDAGFADMISRIAHELRSPLTSIKGFSTTLVKRWDRFTDEQKLEFVQTIRSDSERMSRVVAEVLDLARLEAGRLELNRTQVHLLSIATRAREQLAALPGAERVAFEKERLYPLAGIDPGLADKFARIQELVDRLGYAASEGGRRYLDGKLDGPATAEWIARYGLWPKARAQQRVRFTDQYRSYVINYTLGQDMVREHIEARGGTPENRRKRWDEFKKLLASPRLPSDLERKNR